MEDLAERYGWIARRKAYQELPTCNRAFLISPRPSSG
jgi:hypothetical protein